MNTETAANPADGSEVTPFEETSARTEAHAPAVGDDQNDGNAAETSEIDGLDNLLANEDPEFAEIEIDGKTFKVPAELKDGYLRDADYRRKTMDLAEQRRANEATQQQLEQRAKLDEAEFKAHVRSATLADTLQQFQQIDWDAFEEQDPFEAQKAWRKFQSAQTEFGGLQSALAQHNAQKQQQAQQDFAKRRSQVLETVAREIPGFNTELQDKLEGFAVQYGYSKEAIAANADPADYKLMHLAYIGQQVIEQRKKAGQQKAAAAVVPAAEVKGRAAPIKPLDDRASVDQWMKARNAQRT